MKIDIDNNKVYDGNLVLINDKFPLRNNKQEDLVSVFSDFSNILMKRVAVNHLNMIFNEIKCHESIVAISGYRTLKEQIDIYNQSLKDRGIEFTNKFVAKPCHSEHQTGLAIDLAEKREEIDFICPDFSYDGICGSFRKFISKYGFIERYLKGKEHITNIAHEPWHFRYVGYPHSKIISMKGFVLEEYIEYVKQFSYEGKHLEIEEENKIIEVFYIKASQNDTTQIYIPKKYIYQISGNNTDGFIVTLWRDRYEKK